MLWLLQEEGQTKVGYALGLVVAAIVVLLLVGCATCSVLLLLGPQIGNVFSGITSGLEHAG